ARWSTQKGRLAAEGGRRLTGKYSGLRDEVREQTFTPRETQTKAIKAGRCYGPSRNTAGRKDRPLPDASNRHQPSLSRGTPLLYQKNHLKKPATSMWQTARKTCIVAIETTCSSTNLTEVLRASRARRKNLMELITFRGRRKTRFRRASVGG